MIWWNDMEYGYNVNSFADKANYYGTHVLQKKKCCALQENVVWQTTDQYVVVCKVLTA